MHTTMALNTIASDPLATVLVRQLPNQIRSSSRLGNVPYRDDVATVLHCRHRHRFGALPPLTRLAN